jgi:predicted GNAT family acetyltransferase
MKIVHTEVPPDLAGHGIAGDLMRAALETARSNGWRVRPACSYAEAFLKAHLQYADLLA